MELSDSSSFAPDLPCLRIPISWHRELDHVPFSLCAAPVFMLCVAAASPLIARSTQQSIVNRTRYTLTRHYTCLSHCVLLSSHHKRREQSAFISKNGHAGHYETRPSIMGTGPVIIDSSGNWMKSVTGKEKN
jgi:hypothetical protein